MKHPHKRIQLIPRLVLILFFIIPMMGLSQTLEITPLANSNLKDLKVLLLEDKAGGMHHSSALVIQGYWEEFAASENFSLTVTGNFTDINASNLANYNLLVFNYTDNVANRFNSAQQQAFTDYINNGGHWAGYHTAAMPREGQWDWYRHNVILGLYTPNYHGLQDATMNKTTDAGVLADPIMTGLPETFSTNDEWYAFSQGDFFDEAKVMYYIDEPTLNNHDHAALGNIDAYQLSLPVAVRHPIMWYRENPRNGGRVFYTGLIHNPAGAQTDFIKLMVLRSAEYISGIDPVAINEPIFMKGENLKFTRNKNYIQINVFHIGDYRAVLTDSKGAVQQQIEFINQKKINISTEELPPGVFLLGIEYKGSLISQNKFVVY